MINALAFRASRSTVYSLFCEQARRAPDAIAMQHDGEQLTYAELSDRVMNAAGRLTSAGVRAGDRVAILSENCLEYTQVQLAAARLGAIVACLNWRLSAPEIAYCIQLVEPKVLLVSRRFSALHKACGVAVPAPESLPDFLRVVPGHLAAPCPDVDPESGLLLLYTSGTTGHPKAALISHRAEIARMCALRLDLGLAASDAYIAWSPMFHMGGTEHTLATLMCGGTVVVVDGMKPDAIVDALAAHQVGWLLLVPASIEPVLECIERRGVVPRVRVVGCMADLVPGELIARTTQALRAPFLNSFGATETGMPPASADVIPVGAVPERLGKRLSSLCETRLVDAAGRDVAAGQPGEVVVRGPTLFSGYWNADAVNRTEFREGWFRMGDLFRAEPDGRYEFVGRAKYLIKTGGENVYPAEIERVLLADARISEAAVVRAADERWGEVPVAYVARREAVLTEADVLALCRAQLAAYKCPKRVVFIADDQFPRSATGKVMREDLEKRASAGAVAPAER